MSPPGIYVAGATTAITRRTVCRKAFLAPWDPRVGDVCLYSLADAQRHTGVAVHYFTTVVSHYHGDVTPRTDNLPEFLRRLNRDISCGLHAVLCEQRYDAPRELFDDRQTHRMRLVDAAAQASHLIYHHLNTVAAGLVRRPEHMPQPTFDFGLWKTGFLEVRRPELYFGADRPEVLRLVVTPPPELYRAFGGDLDALVHHMNKLSETALSAIAQSRRRAPLGAREVRGLHPWSEPRTLRETGGQPVPTFRIGARGIVGRRMRVEGAREVRAFRASHHATRIARRSGDLAAAYPFGTYAAREYRGEPVEEEAPPQAIVARPGPTLDEVRAELEGARRGAVPHDLLDEVRAALREEAAAIVEECDADAERADTASADTASADAERAETTSAEPEEDRPPSVTRHRFDARPQRCAPARVVTLRDRRRGPSRRPRGSDPPV
ncbi:MAG: hypothetical protein H6719_12340 [Sandaracinaceae bacterium]|nr:hypothetical protein [Sandaracinaceae bacterium]